MLIENIRAALAGIRANKMRSFLTMLGILIGIAAIISIIIAGNGMTQYFQDSMNKIGANKIEFYVSQKNWDSNPTMKPSDYISLEMIENICEQFPNDIESVSMDTQLGEGTVKSGKNYAKVTVMGSNSDSLNISIDDKEDWIAGRKPTSTEQQEGANVAVVSDKFVSNMFHGDNDAALGQSVDVLVGNQYYTYTIIGIYKYYDSQRASSSDYDITTTMYLPLKTVHKVSPKEASMFSYIDINARQDADQATVAKEVSSYMNKTYYRSNKDFYIEAMTMEEAMKQAESEVGMIKGVMGAIGAISLLVGGIGVMNIMIVSITERTREIGTRKALGATNGSIRMQFIVEAVVICFIGGLLGLGLGTIFGRIIPNIIGFPGTITLENIIFCLAFSMAFGIFFGYYPANRAAKMNPIDALRYE